MTVGRSCEGWLIWIDQQRPDAAYWADPEKLYLLSWAMLMFLPRRMGTLLAGAEDSVIDLAEVEDLEQRTGP